MSTSSSPTWPEDVVVARAIMDAYDLEPNPMFRGRALRVRALMARLGRVGRHDGLEAEVVSVLRSIARSRQTPDEAFGGMLYDLTRMVFDDIIAAPQTAGSRPAPTPVVVPQTPSAGLQERLDEQF